MPASTTSHVNGTAGRAGDRGPISVFVADDHPILREGMRKVISEEPGLSVCGEADAVDETRRLVNELRPDLVLLDSDLPGGDLLGFVEELRSRPDAPRVVVLCGRRGPGGKDANALRRGASAFVSKRADGEELLRVLRHVLGGQTYFSPEMIDWLLRRRGRPGGNRP